MFAKITLFVIAIQKLCAYLDSLRQFYDGIPEAEICEITLIDRISERKRVRVR